MSQPRIGFSIRYCISLFLLLLVFNPLVSKFCCTRTMSWVASAFVVPAIRYRGCLGRTTRLGGFCRWMASSDSTTKSKGEIFIYDEQEALENLDLTRLQNTVSRIRSELGYDHYDVTLVLVEDEQMQQTNKETRGMDSPTDILSFPFHPHIKPGVLAKPEFDNIPDLFTLGDMMLDVPYVIRRCQEDKEALQDIDDEERGVSGAMARVMDPETRIHMLIVHGMLHLVGYDHIEDDDYELMVTREEELLDKVGLPT